MPGNRNGNRAATLTVFFDYGCHFCHVFPPHTSNRTSSATQIFALGCRFGCGFFAFSSRFSPYSEMFFTWFVIKFLNRSVSQTLSLEVAFLFFGCFCGLPRPGPVSGIPRGYADRRRKEEQNEKTGRKSSFSQSIRIPRAALAICSRIA